MKMIERPKNEGILAWRFLVQGSLNVKDSGHVCPDLVVYQLNMVVKKLSYNMAKTLSYFTSSRIGPFAVRYLPSGTKGPRANMDIFTGPICLVKRRQWPCNNL